MKTDTYSLAPYEEDAISKALLGNFKRLKTSCQLLKLDSLMEGIDKLFEQKQGSASLYELIEHLIAVSEEILKKIGETEPALKNEQLQLRQACDAAEEGISVIQVKQEEINSVIDAIIEKVKKELFSYPQEIRESAMDAIESALLTYDKFDKNPTKFQTELSETVSRAVEESIRGVVDDIQKDVRHELIKVWEQIKDPAYQIFQQILLFNSDIIPKKIENLHKSAFEFLQSVNRAYDNLSAKQSVEVSLILKKLKKTDVISDLIKEEDKHKIRLKSAKFGYVIGLVAGVILMGTLIVMKFDFDDFMIVFGTLFLGVGLCGFAGAIGGVLIGEIIFITKKIMRRQLKEIKADFKKAYQDAVNRELESGKIAQILVDICFEPLRKQILGGINSLSEPLQHINIEFKKRESLISARREQLNQFAPEVRNMLNRTQKLSDRLQGIQEEHILQFE
jgi:predicted  nucleic acid-binding Zn-ribbon protein